MDGVGKQSYGLALGPEALEEICLEAVIARRCAEIEEIQRDIQSLDDVLKEKNAKEIEEIQKLRAELEGLMTAGTRAAEAEAPDGGKQNMEDVLKATRAHNKRLEEQGERGKKAPSARAKELFAKIAQKTHPDKTSDPEHHAMFEYARKAKDRNDIEELMAILKTLGINAGRAYVSKLVSRLAELRARDAETRATLESLHASDQYRIAKDYKNPVVRQYVERHYSSVLDNAIEKLKDKIRAIDNKRYAKPVKWPTFSEIFRATSW